MTPLTDVLVPPNGEGTRATVLRWCKAVGDTVVKDEPLVELETDKVTVEIPAPADGILIEVLKQVDAEVNPEDVLARLSLAGESTPMGESTPTGELTPARETAASTGADASALAPAASDAAGARKPLSPSV